MQDILSLVNGLKAEQADQPTTHDHIVKLDLDKDIVLALDENGNELCRFAFEVDGRDVAFTTPKLFKWSGFVRKMAILFSRLAQFAPNAQMPDNKIENYIDPTTNAVWNTIVTKVIMARQDINALITNIFFKYLDGCIEGIEKRWWQSDEKAQIKWFRRHVEIADLQKIFAAVLAVDDLIKKNATIVLEKQFQRSRAANGVHSLVKRPEFQSNISTDTQSYTYAPL